MRHLIALASAAVVSFVLLLPVAAQVAAPEVPPQRLAEARRLLTTHAANSVDEIAAFNRRAANCDRAAAAAAAGFDAAHAVSFMRTRGWRWEAAGSRWILASPAEAEVTLRYSGPARSGTVTADGHERSFCYAESPDRITATARSDPHERETRTKTMSLALPQLAPGFDGAGRPDAEGSPSTVPAQVAARIAQAKAELAEKVQALAAQAKAPRPATCKPVARVGSGTITRSLRWNAATRAWVRAETDTAAEVVLRVETAGSLLNACLPFEAARLTASAIWEDEGTNVLTFHVDWPRPSKMP